MGCCFIRFDESIYENVTCRKHPEVKKKNVARVYPIDVDDYIYIYILYTGYVLYIGYIYIYIWVMYIWLRHFLCYNFPVACQTTGSHRSECTIQICLGRSAENHGNHGKDPRKIKLFLTFWYGDGSKPCTPSVHLKIAGIYGCSSP